MDQPWSVRWCRAAALPCCAQLTQKKTTMQFKTLDSTLTTDNKDTGEKKTATYRCVGE